MGTLGAEALLIGKSPWLAAAPPGWGWRRGRGRGGAWATSSLSEQPELMWGGGCSTDTG